MEIYLAIIAVIFLLNILPAFAPPTWAALVFFIVNYEVNPYILVPIAVVSATSGRAFLAWYFRKFAHLVPSRFSRNMSAAGQYLERDASRRRTVFAIFAISPISTAQLFEAAGISQSIKLKPLLAAFAVGRTCTYIFYVSGATAAASTSIGQLIIDHLKSPWAIAAQLFMIALFIVGGSIDWQKRFKAS